MESRPWVVLKFGGTSVSTAERWRTIGEQAARRLDEGLRPLIVCSALSGVSNLLEKLVREAPHGGHEPLLHEIEGRHTALAAALGVDAALVRPDLEEVARLALGASLIREASPKLHARVMAAGEILSTRLGAAYLNRIGQGTRWLDARDLLVAQPEPHVPEARRILSAACGFERDDELAARLAAEPAPILLTQGFIARDRSGATVLLGRGGSDTSAGYLAARLGAVRCEIWTDVPGMYSANPRQVPQARLLRRLDYDEAQEIASMGAKVLHPRCIAPVRAHRIPMHIRCTERPDAEGTVIEAASGAQAPQVKSVSSRTGLTLVSLETVGMWQQVGFLSDVFATFKQHGLSIDLVSTSESNVTVSLDPTANALDPDTIAALVAALEPLCEARTIGPCAAVSLVGRNIRALLHRLGPALEAFEEQRVHLVSQAASDLNLTFVVDEAQADKLVRTLHGMLFQGADHDPLFGPPMGGEPRVTVDADAWWRRKRDALIALAQEGPRYVYDAETLRESARELKGLSAVSRVLYAVKANPNPDVLRIFHEAGLGFECVSPGEVERVFELFPDIAPERLLFTPNFAPRPEYEAAFARGVRVTLDNLHPLERWPEVFRGKDVFVRLDPGHGGRGHHRHVHTGGAASKFGVGSDQLDALARLVQASGARVVGLHAHLGSGIRSSENWAETGAFLSSVTERFPDVRILDLGGGLGVVEKPGQRALDLAAVDASLQLLRAARPDLELWLEPGRFLVARAGVLLTRVTQLKQKGDVAWVGVDTGMNSLIRPALYGAWHEITNLSRLDDDATETVNVVGPICETGDVIGHGRRLPPCREGDVLLVATAGAYGRAMSSWYNLREPAEERLLS